MQIASMMKERPFPWQKFEQHKIMPQALFMCKITRQLINTRWQWDDIFS